MLQTLDVVIGLAVILAGMSLLVTLFVQLVGSVLALRGRSLKWGLQKYLRALGRSETQALNDAKNVLTNALVSDSILADGRLGKCLPKGLVEHWSLASAIRPAELRTLLPEVVGDQDPGPLLRSLGADGEKLKERVRAAAAVVPGVSDLAIETIAQGLTSAYANSERAAAEFEARFEATMDRVTQRFTTRTRIITIIASFLLAFGLHFDVIALFGRLADDVHSRTALVAAAVPLAERDLGAERAERVQAALTAAHAAADESSKIKLEAIEDLASPQDVEKWINTRREGVKQEDTAAYDGLLVEFRQEFADRESEAFHQQLKLFTGDDTLERLELIPDYTGDHAFWDLFKRPKHFLGIVAGGALLGLGAPFWFNTLRKLTNLRPLVATKENEERDEKREGAATT